MALQNERPLGIMEKYQTSKYLNNGYGSVTCTVFLRHQHLLQPAAERTTSDRLVDTKRFYLDQLYAPLCRLVDKHPQLSLVIADYDKPTVHFFRLAQFDLNAIVSIQDQTTFWDKETLSQIIGEESDREFDLDQHTVPLWHLRICTHSELPNECSITLAIHHAIGDGTSVSIFWRDLYTELNKNNQEPEIEDYIIKSNPEKPLLGAYENRQPPVPTLWDKISLSLTERIKQLLPQSLKESWYPDGWAGDLRGVTDKTLARHETEIRAIQVDKATWQKVCMASKKHGVTPHAPIMAAIMSSFAQLWANSNNQNDGDATSTSVISWTPINCRGFCNPPIAKDEMGNFVGAYVHTWTPDLLQQASFWDKAKTYHKQLKANKYNGAKSADDMSSLKYPDDYQTWWYDHWNATPMARSGGIECSDLGRFIPDGHDDGDAWQIDGVWFSQSSQMFTMALNLNCISTKDCMYGTVGWQKGSLNVSKVEAFGPLVIEALKKCCE